MFAVIDRFEGRFAIVELPDKKMMNIEKSRIPKGAKEGDVLLIEGSSITIDEKETAKRKLEIERLMKDIWAE